MGPGSNGLGTLSHFGQGPNIILAKCQISFGPGVKSHLSQGPNLIWARGHISFGPGTKSHLIQGLNLIWARGQISLGPGAESHLVEYWKIIPSPFIISNLDHVFTTFWLILFFLLLLKMSLISDVIASPKGSLITDIIASPVPLHVSENDSLTSDVTESTILLEILHTPFGLHLMLLHHQFCRKFCKLLLAKY